MGESVEVVGGFVVDEFSQGLGSSRSAALGVDGDGGFLGVKDGGVGKPLCSVTGLGDDKKEDGRDDEK